MITRPAKLEWEVPAEEESEEPEAPEAPQFCEGECGKSAHDCETYRWPEGEKTLCLGCAERLAHERLKEMAST